MNHIDTTSPEEKKARKDYAEPKDGKPVIADKKLEDVWRELLDLRHKMDLDALRASQLKAIIMNAMGHMQILQNKAGKTLATWTRGNKSASVDYKGLCAKYKVTKEDIDAYTKIKTSSRVFSIEEAGE